MLLVHGLGGAHLNWMAVAPQARRPPPRLRARPAGIRTVAARRSPIDDRRECRPADAGRSTWLSHGSDRPGGQLDGRPACRSGSRRMHPNLVDALVLVDPAVPAPRRRVASSTRPGLADLHRHGVHAAMGRSAAEPRSGRARAGEPRARDHAAGAAPTRAGSSRRSSTPTSRSRRSGWPSRLAGVLLCGDAFAGGDPRAEAAGLSMGAGGGRADTAPAGRSRPSRQLSPRRGTSPRCVRTGSTTSSPGPGTCPMLEVPGEFVEVTQRLAGAAGCGGRAGRRAPGGWSAGLTIPVVSAIQQPLTHAPVGWGGRIRTFGWRIQSPLPYHLATPQ